MKYFLAGLSMVLTLACATSAPAWAQTATQAAVDSADSADRTDGEVWTRYPAGSIHSTADADAALRSIDRQRGAQSRLFIEQQRECYQRFFVSSCLKKVQDENRTVNKKIKTVEIEANTYLRQAKADDRDAALAEQRASELADAPRRAKEQQENAAENARKVAESAQRTAEADARARSIVPGPDRVAAHAQKMQDFRNGQATEAQKAAENTAAYERKVEAAHKRQKEVADNKAARQADHAAKPGDAAGGAQAAPATAPEPKK